MQHGPVPNGPQTGRRRARRKRVLAFTAIGALVLAGLVGAAAADYPSSGVAVYTGCLTPGSTGGQIVNVAVSSTTPAKPCASTQTLVHLSGSTITSVQAGTGLTGGGSNGAVSLGLGASYALPQSCANHQLPAWDGSSWQCASQTSYLNGTGLDLDGSTFSVDQAFRLPQGCSSGQVVASNGSGDWSCQAPATYDGSDFALSNQSCPDGQFTTGIDASGGLGCSAPSGLSGVHVVERRGRADGTGGVLAITVACPSGETAIGGGGSLDFIHGFPADNPMVDNRPSAGGWLVEWYITKATEQDPQLASAYAVCVTGS